MIKKVKSKDIAARMGLSATLVSLVLNNKADQHGIRKETQERVFAVATHMGYFKSEGGRSDIKTIEEQPGIIGMIVTSLNDPFVFSIAPYLQKAFESVGLGFSVFCRDSDNMRFSRQLKSFKNFFSGIILVGEAADENSVRSLYEDHYPLILLEKSYANLKLNAVCSDKKAGAILMTDHLASLGYKKLLVISYERHSERDKEILTSLRSLTKGSKKFTDIQSVSVKPPLAGDSIDFSLIESFLRPPFSTDCIISVDAGTVFPLFASLQEQNIRVPQDIALVSMEDYVAFDMLTTPVTRLRIPLKDMALKTAGILWTEIKNKGKGKVKRQVKLAPELVLKSSCGSFVK